MLDAAHFREAQENSITFPEIRGPILKQVVRFLVAHEQHSSGSIDFKLSTALELCMVAHYLDIDALVNVAAEAVGRNLEDVTDVEGIGVLPADLLLKVTAHIISLFAQHPITNLFVWTRPDSRPRGPSRALPRRGGAAP